MSSYSYRGYVPGIFRYPDLERRLNQEFTSSTNCSSCNRSAVVNKYKTLVAARDKKERHVR